MKKDTKEQRFSKAALLEDLRHRSDSLEKRHAFDPTNGWSQIKIRRDFETVMAYGQYSLLQDLIEELEE